MKQTKLTAMAIIGCLAAISCVQPTKKTSEKQKEDPYKNISLWDFTKGVTVDYEGSMLKYLRTKIRVTGIVKSKHISSDDFSVIHLLGYNETNGVMKVMNGRPFNDKWEYMYIGKGVCILNKNDKFDEVVEAGEDDFHNKIYYKQIATIEGEVQNIERDESSIYNSFDYTTNLINCKIVDLKDIK